MLLVMPIRGISHWTDAILLILSVASTSIITGYLLIRLYGDGAGNTVEENSSVFSLIRMR